MNHHLGRNIRSRVNGLLERRRAAVIVLAGLSVATALSGAVFVASTLNPNSQFTAASSFTLQATMTDPGTPLRGTAPLAATASDSGGPLITSVVIQRSPAGTGTWTDVCTDTTSPYGCSFDTTSVSDGLYDFRAIATNDLGDTRTSTAVTDRRVDNTPPTVTMTDPGPWVRGTITLASTSSDSGSGMASVLYQYKLSSIGTWTDICTDTTSPYSCNLNTTTLTNGAAYDFRATATDVAGNSQTSAAITGALVDNAAPTAVTMNNPGSPLTGTVPLSGSASDAHSGVASMTFQRSPAGAGTWTDACTDTTSPYGCDFDTTSVADGLYDFRAIATDAAGNTANSTSVTNRRIDNTAPTVSLTDPGAWLRGTVTLSATASDGAGAGVTSVKIQYSPTGAGTWTDVCTDTSSPYTCNLNTTTLTNGAGYDLRAIATDGVGLSTTSNLVADRRVDNASPTATMNDPGSPLTGTVTLSGDGTDQHSGVASVTLERRPSGGSTWTNVCIDATSPYSCSFDTTALGDGLYDLRAVSTDVAGNVTNSTAVTDRRVDNNPPSVTMNDPGWLTANETLTASASDPSGGTGVSSVRIQYSPTGQDSWTDVCTDTSSPYNCTLDTSGLIDGAGYDLRAIATDGAGFTTTSAIVSNRRVDNTAPSATMNDPGDWLRGTVSFTADSADAVSGVASVRIQLEYDGIWYDLCTDTTDPYSCSLDTDILPDGVGYDLRAIATDGAGLSTTSEVVADRRVDNVAPTSVTMTDPGSPLTGTIALSGGATDSHSGVASMTFQRSPAGTGNWSEACTDTTAPYSCDYDTSGLADGLYDFRVRATDVAGNTTNSSTRTNRRIDNNAPTVALNDPGPWLATSETVSATASDATGGSGVASVKIQYSPVGEDSWTDVCTDSSSPYSCIMDTSTLNNGQDYDLRAIATDGVGLSTTSALWTSRVDNNAPTATMNDPGSPLTGTVTLTGDASDTHSGVASVKIQRSPAGAGTWTDVCTDTTSPYSCSFNTAGVADGLYDLRAVSTDVAGNTTNSTSVTNRRIDNTAPTVSLTDPGWMGPSETLSATASDPSGGAGVSSVKIQYSPTGAGTWTDVCTDTTSPYDCTLDTTTLTEGAGYDLRAIATDGAGFSTTSALVVNRRVDRAAPSSATMNDPGSPIRGTVTLSGSAADALSGIASLKIQRSPAGAGTWTDVCTDTTSPYSCSFNTAGVADGFYDLRAIATDLAGNQTNSSLVANREIDNTAPSASDVQTANGGGTAGVAGSGDSITLTYSEAMSPGSILSGWNGSAVAVTVRIDNPGDRLEIWDNADTTRLNLTSTPHVELIGNYVPSGGAKFNATMVMSGSAVTTTLGSLRSGSVNAPASAGTMRWTPSASATDLAGNACSTTLRNETGASDAEF